MDKTGIGDRMKNNYESRAKTFLTRRTPVIMRLDGKAFHTFTRGMDRPFDENLNQMMRATTIKLCQEIQGAKCAYMQSDEISILITDYDKLTTDAWFDYNVQKMTSVSASIATAEFNKSFGNIMMHLAGQLYQRCEGDYTDEQYSKMETYFEKLQDKTAYFDSRVFNIPKEEVVNYFVWRQQDWLRNSIQLAGQSEFSQSQLHKKNTMEIKQMLLEQKDICWENFEDKWKNGNFCMKVSGEWVFASKCKPFNDPEMRAMMEEL